MNKFIGDTEARIIDECLNDGCDVKITKTKNGIKIMKLKAKVVFRSLPDNGSASTTSEGQREVQSVRIDIDSNKIREKKETLTFAASGKSELRVPKEKDDNTFLLVSTVEIKSENEPDVFDGEISAEFYFEIGTMVKDYDNIVREQALPVVQEEVIFLLSCTVFLSKAGFSFLKIILPISFLQLDYCP